VNNLTDKEKSKETATENVDILDTYKENMLRTVDEVSKYQPQYAQSISNLQQDYLQVTKELINNMVAIQKSWYRNARSPYIPATAPYAAQFKKQSDEVTSQAFHLFDTANKMAIDSLNVARENMKLYAKTYETMNEYNANLADTWSNFFTSAQKQYFK
jgi:hypothetical protein